MSDSDTLVSIDAQRAESPGSDAIETTEAYEIEEGVVFYDADNPLAWVQARSAIRLDNAV